MVCVRMEQDVPTAWDPIHVIALVLGTREQTVTQVTQDYQYFLEALLFELF